MALDTSLRITEMNGNPPPPLQRIGGGGEGGGRGEGQLFTCPYPLKVQARPPRDQKLALQSRVSWQAVQRIGGGGVSETFYMPISTEDSGTPTTRPV